MNKIISLSLSISALLVLLAGCSGGKETTESTPISPDAGVPPVVTAPDPQRVDPNPQDLILQQRKELAKKIETEFFDNVRDLEELFVEYELEVDLDDEKLVVEKINTDKLFLKRFNNRELSLTPLKEQISKIVNRFKAGSEVWPLIDQGTHKIYHSVLKLFNGGMFDYHLRRTTNMYVDFCREYFYFKERDPRFAQDIEYFTYYLLDWDLQRAHNYSMNTDLCGRASDELSNKELLAFSDFNYHYFISLELFQGSRKVKRISFADHRYDPQTRAIDLTFAWKIPLLKEVSLSFKKIYNADALSRINSLTEVKIHFSEIDSLSWIGKQKKLKYLSIEYVNRTNPFDGPFDLSFLNEFDPAQFEYMNIEGVDILACPTLTGPKIHCKVP